jgi:hypothetical protein
MKSRLRICPTAALLLVSGPHMYSQKPASAPFGGFGARNSIAVAIVALDNGPIAIAGQFASLNLGRIGWGSRNNGAGNTQESTLGFTVITTRFGLRLSCPGSPPRPSAELRVALGPVPNGVEVLVDGLPIRADSSVVSSYEPCATTNAHTLAVRFATSVLPGPFHYSVDFTATLR